jgi:hypothetical protein
MADREPKSFIVQKVLPLSGLPADEPGFVRIRLRADLLSGEVNFKKIAVALKDCPGKSYVLLELADERESCVLSLREVRVGDAGTVQESLAGVVPPEAFEVA